MRWRKSKSPKTEPCRAPVLRSSHRQRWINIYSQFAEDFCFVFIFFLQRKQKSFQSFEKKKEAGTVAGAGVTLSSIVLDNTCML